MWREAARSLPAEPPEGMAVHSLGYLSIYEAARRAARRHGGPFSRVPVDL
jgi:hypothetical protein